MSTATKIRDLRKAHKLSQTELAKLVHVSQATITSWETGRADPSSSALDTLATFFNVSADYLLDREEKAEQSKNDVDLKDDPVVLSYGGKPISDEDMDVIKAILSRHQND